METVYPNSTREATERVVKILGSNYAKVKLDKVAAAEVHIDKDQRKNLLSLRTEFEDLFGRTLGKWYNTPVKLEVKPRSEPLNFRYHPVPKINNETIHQ